MEPTSHSAQPPSSARPGDGTSRAAPSDRVAAHSDTDVVVAARGLVCRYGGFVAVRGIDFDVQRGELFALLGTNGAGKTTTLETLEGHRPADEGRVRVLGTDPRTDRRRLAARIGVVFQHSGVPAGLTPREMLALWTRLTPDAAHHHDIDTILMRVELTHRADVRIGQLSGGERRRLDLAVALCNDPEVVFLDEPTTGMDPEARQRTWQIIRDLLADQVTVVLTTHYLEEAEALADRLAILHQGLIATSGTLAQVAAAHPARIQARLSREAPDPPPIGDTRRLDPEGRLTIATRQLQHDLHRLLRWADEHAVTLDELQATEASLAQVFHHIAAGHNGDSIHQEPAR